MIPAGFGATVLRRPESSLRGPRRTASWKKIGRSGAFSGRHRRCITILLDPGRFLNRLLGLILAQPAMWPPRLIAVESAEEMELSAAAKSERLAQTVNGRSFRDLGLLIVLLAVALSGCGDKAPPQAAAAPPPVTVAQPTKRTVTDWDEFTGRFEAVEEVQVRARVGGFVTNVEFRDGEIVKAGDLSVPDRFPSLRSRRRAGRRSVADARAKAELQARTRPRPYPGPDQCGLRTGRRPAPPGLAGSKGRARPWPRAC